MIRSCRDCSNFEERRDVDNAVLCKRRIGPYTCCEEFEPRDERLNVNRLYHRFCVECANFEDVNGIPICAKNRGPGVACEAFASRLKKLNATRQNNHMKAALVLHADQDNCEPEPIPTFLMEIGRKIKW